MYIYTVGTLTISFESNIHNTPNEININ